jgi:hypothetical protein
MFAMQLIESLAKDSPLRITKCQAQDWSKEFIMLFADLDTLLPITENSFKVCNNWVDPAVLLKTAPNLTLLLYRHFVGVLVVRF